MADAEKEKAEKLAAAKKRFEQLKKEQQKKGKKGATKKKADKAEDVETSKAEEPEPAEDVADTTAAIEDDNGQGEKENEPVIDDQQKPPTTRQPSISLQSKQRSESFRQGNTGLSSPSAEVQDIYHKQAARIEELEKENKTLREQQVEGASRLAKTEEELESLRESSSTVAELKSNATDANKLRTELASTQRQLAQAQQAARGTQRRTSGTSPDFTEQLASKTSTIESLEMDVSNLRNQLNEARTTISERETAAADLEERAKVAETATASIQQELDALKVSIAFPSDETKAANEDPEALTKRITVLESELRSANANLEAAAQRAASLEQKIEALTKLHRDANTHSQAKDKELSDLRAQLRSHERPSHVRDASDFDLQDEETESGALQARIRALEAENFDLRRGVWREKRAELQPGMLDDQDAASPGYEDVDLNGPYTPLNRSRTAGSGAMHSTFQDVIASGISAFTGRTREQSQPGPGARKTSLGLMTDDGEDDFDPEAFRLAQEEEAKKRLERVREVKRGLDNWKGWRVDLVDLRSSAAATGREFGPVFEL